jgi:twinkle protein
MNATIIDSLNRKYELILDANPRTDQKGEHYIICPICTPYRRHEHQKDKKLAINYKISYKPWRCNHCGESGSIITDNKKRIADIQPITKKFNIKKIPEPVQEAFYEKWKISKKTFDYFKVMFIRKVIKQQNVKKGEEEYKGKFREVPSIYFPSYDGTDLIDVQFRDGNKNFASETGSTKIFWNINDMKGARIGMITEGRKDTMSVYESGCEIPSCSVPNGTTMSDRELSYFKRHGKIDITKQLDLKYLDHHYWVFEDMETVIIGTDDDPPGIKLREELARRIGKHKCKYIKWGEWKTKDNKPCKDANDVLYHCGKEELKNAWKKSHSFPVSGIIRISDLKDELKYERDNGKEKGFSTGFSFLDPHFTIMPGHLNLLNGFMNMGKTALFLQFALQCAISYNWKSALYMPENYPPRRLADKINQMLIGKSTDLEKDNPATQKEIDQAMEFINEYIYFIHEEDHEIVYSHKDLREKVGEMIAKYGVKMFFKDPWNRIRETRNKNEQMYDYLNRELSEEAFFVEKNNIAWFISAHPKTPDVPKTQALPRPSPHQVYGGEVWPSKAHNILTLHRTSTGADNTKSLLYVDKTKDHETIGIPCPNSPIELDFRRKSQRFFNPEDEASEEDHLLDQWKHGTQTDIAF